MQIIVNGRKFYWEDSEISYEDVVALAGWSAIPQDLTVIYRHFGLSGSLVAGTKAAVAPGLVVNVAYTNNA